MCFSRGTGRLAVAPCPAPMRGAGAFALFCGMAWTLGPASGTPEYLEVERPLGDSLAEASSPTESIGVSPESWLEERDPFFMHPSRRLPWLREEHVPETGHPFIDDMTFSVQPRFYYFYRDVEDTAIQEAAAGGGALSMESGWLHDTVRIGLAGYTSQKIHGPSDRDGTGLLRSGQQSYTVLGEAFLELRHGDASLKAGRLRSDLPFINDHDIRMTPNTFEGVAFGAVVMPGLKVAASHLSGIKPRAASGFIPMSERAGVPGRERGVTTLSAHYDFSEDAYIGFSEQYGWDMFNGFYAEAGWFRELCGPCNLRFSAQFTDQRSVGEELLGSFSTQAVGARVAFEIEEFVASAVWTWTSEDARIRHPWGGSPSFNSIMIADFDRAGEESLGVGATYDFSRWGAEGLSLSARWVTGETPDRGPAASPDQEELNFTVDYQPPVEVLERFWLRLRYAHNDREGGMGGIDQEDFRVILNYSYSF